MLICPCSLHCNPFYTLRISSLLNGVPCKAPAQRGGQWGIAFGHKPLHIVSRPCIECYDQTERRYFMAVINTLSNTASITYGGNTITSLPAVTALLLAPTIVKIVDKSTASIGDVLNYTITVLNPSASPSPTIPFTDVVPAGATYVAGSFKLNNTTVTPTITGSTLTYTIPSIASLGTATITFQVTVVGGTT